MSAVQLTADGPARAKTHIEQALSKPVDPEKVFGYLPLEIVHDAAFHCGKVTDFCNRMLDEVWPLLRAEIYHDYLSHHVATPIVAMDRLVHSTPWDWDIQNCEGCGKMVGTPVMKKRRAWLGDKYCVECERILLGGTN